jgi:hypothetical protein
MTYSADSFGDTESQLRALVARGFRFLHPKASGGSVLAVVGVRAHDNVVDVMWLHGETDARAVRMPADERDVMSPTQTLWENSGHAAEVLAQLLSLPDDHVPGLTGMVRTAQTAAGCWVAVSPNTSRWLAATG